MASLTRGGFLHTSLRHAILPFGHSMLRHSLARHTSGAFDVKYLASFIGMKPHTASRKVFSSSSSPQQSPSSFEHNIVVAVDTTEDSLAALRWTVRYLYRAGKSKLTLLHVVPNVYQSPATGSIWFEETADPRIEEALRSECREFFSEKFIQKVQDEVEAPLDIGLELVDEGETSHIGWAVSRAAERLKVRGVDE